MALLGRTDCVDRVLRVGLRCRLPLALLVVPFCGVVDLANDSALLATHHNGIPRHAGGLKLYRIRGFFVVDLQL